MLPPRETGPSDEVPEDTPYYLNPKVLRQGETPVDFTAEEQMEGAFDENSSSSAVESGMTESQAVDSDNPWVNQPTEKMEAVLNSGMQFIGGLLEMATGQKISAKDDDGRMVRIDKATGEVTLKFKLPGF